MIELNITLGILIVNFLVIMFILSRKLFKPMLEHLEKRDEIIQGSLKNANEMEEKSGKKLGEYKTKLQEEKKNVLLEQNLLREQALEKQKEVLKSVKSSSEAELSKIKVEINRQIETLRKEFPKLAAVLSSEIVAGVMGKRSNVN